MEKSEISRMIAQSGLVSDQVDVAELTVVLHELAGVLKRAIAGAVVEFGCYRGTTSLYIRRVLDALGDEREFHVYDSFEGLPEKTAPDASPAGLQFIAGELSVSKRDFIQEFKKAGLRTPRIHKGWFNELSDADVPGLVAFAFLDGDYYESVKMPLHLLGSKLAPGAIIVVDDYANEALPGAARAVDEWVRPRGLSVTTVASLGIVRLPS